MGKVICFGELLLRFSPPADQQWLNDGCMPVFVGGAELNVATALCNWNIPVSYVTALPDNYISNNLLEYLSGKGIDTQFIQISGERIGGYFLQQGADLKHAGVIYDRKRSSFYDLKPGMIDWNVVLKECTWFHFSMISPSLNKNVADLCKEAVMAAYGKNISVSVDLNYRPKLWQNSGQTMECIQSLIEYCNVVMGNIWAIEKFLNIPVKPNLMNNKESYIEQSLYSSEAITKLFNRCTQVANTFRMNNDNGLNYYATVFANGQLSISKEYTTDLVIDRAGSGDAFMAGLIYGNYHNYTLQKIIEFATAAAFKKLFVKGDASTATVSEILNDIEK